MTEQFPPAHWDGAEFANGSVISCKFGDSKQKIRNKLLPASPCHGLGTLKIVSHDVVKLSAVVTVAGEGRAGQAVTAGSPTMGSSLNGAIVSSVI